MKSAIALIAIAGFAGAANAQASLDVLINGSNSYTADEAGAGIVDISIVLNKNGSTDGFYANFAGFSQFGGDLVSTAGTFAQPNEAGVQDSTSGNWEGRRAPSTFGFPGGGGGGFRFNAATGGVATGGSIAGIAGAQASSALGGFLQSGDTSIEVYRAQLDLTGVAAGDYSVDFAASLLQVFIDGFAIERAVLNDTTLNGAAITITPTPASVALLGLGGLAAGRRRR